MGIETPSATQMGFVNVIWGAAGLLSGWYMSTGRKWDKETYRMVGTPDGFKTFEGPKNPNEYQIYMPPSHPYYQPYTPPYGPFTSNSNRSNAYGDVDQPKRPPPPDKEY